jgi:hypothetical protein
VNYQTYPLYNFGDRSFGEARVDKVTLLKFCERELEKYASKLAYDT